MVENNQNPITFDLPDGLEGRVALLEQGRVFLNELHQHDGMLVTSHYSEHMVSESNDPDEGLIRTFAEGIRENGLSKRGWVVVLPVHYFTLDIVSLPEVKGKDLEALIERRLARSHMLAGERKAWSYQVLQKIHTENERSIKILIARINQKLLLWIHGALKSNGIRAKYITVPQAGLIQLIKCRRINEEGRKAVLVVDVSSGDTVFSVFVNGVLQQVRFFNEKGLGEKGKYGRFLQVEMKRTLAYHKERFKGEEIGEIILLGSRSNRVGLDDRSFFVPLHRSARDRNTGDKGRGILNLAAGACLAAGEGPIGARIDFSPIRRRIPQIIALAVIALICLLAGVVELSDRVEQSNRIDTDRLARLQSETGLFDSTRWERDNLLKEMDRDSKLASFLDTRTKEHRSIGRSLLALYDNLPKETKIQSISYCRDKEKSEHERASESVKVQVQGDFTGNKTIILLDLIRRLKSTGLFYDVLFTCHGVTASNESGHGLHESVDLELVLP